MANQFPRAAVSAIIVEDGKLLMVKRGCEPNLGLWSLPGGSIDLGETAREAVSREVAEETSMIVEVGGVAAVHDIIQGEHGSVKYHYVVIIFHAKVVSGELKASSDAADARWVSLSDVSGMHTTTGLAELLASLPGEVSSR